MEITHSNSSYLADLSGRQDSLHRAEKQRGNVFQPTACVCRGSILASARASLPGRQRVRQHSDSDVGTLAAGSWGPVPGLPPPCTGGGSSLNFGFLRGDFFLCRRNRNHVTAILVWIYPTLHSQSRALVLSTVMFSKGVSHHHLSWLSFGINWALRRWSSVDHSL